MSIDATRATWKLSKTKITAIQKLILLSLADRAGENAECWPSLKRIIADTNIDRKTLIENRKILIEKKLIEYTGQFMGKQKQIPVMRLTYVQSREDSDDENYNDLIFTSTENGTRTSTENGTGNQYRKRDTEPKRIEPKKEPIKDIVDFEKSTTKKSKNKDYKKDERFMRFYNAYPRKEKPRDAWKAFQSIVGNDDALLEKIMEDLEKRIINHTPWSDPQYIGLPASYLRSATFDGEIFDLNAINQQKKIRTEQESKTRMAQQEKMSQQLRVEEAAREKRNNKDAEAFRETMKKISIPDGLKALKKSMGIRRGSD